MKKILSFSLIIASAVILSGCSKQAEEAKSQVDAAASEMQVKLDEQQAKIEEQQTRIDEQQAKVEELQKSADTKVNSGTVKQKTTTRSVADEVYCQTNAKQYSATAYDARKEMTDETRDHCIEKDSTDCDNAVKRAKKRFEEYKIEYEAYHKKCG